MDDRHSEFRSYSDRPRGGYDQRDSRQAQSQDRRRDSRETFSAQSQGRPDRGKYSHDNRDRCYRHNPPTQHSQDYREDRSSNSHRRSRSRSGERHDRPTSLNDDRKSAEISYNYGSDPRNFNDSRRFDGRQKKQQERLEKLERMGGPSPEDLSKIPTYLNPKVVNVTKVIEQQEKRKLLWQGKKAQPEASTAAPEGSSEKPIAKVWENATFSGDADGSVANKFKKLMGLKHGDGGGGGSTKSGSGSSTAQDDTSPSSSASTHVVSQDVLFRDLDRQYELARLSAHTQKGLGLGFGSR